MTLHLCCNLQIVSVLVWMPLKATEPVTCSRHAKNGTLKNITMWSCQASEQTRMSIPHTFKRFPMFSPMFLGCVGALLLSTFVQRSPKSQSVQNSIRNPMEFSCMQSRQGLRCYGHMVEFFESCEFIEVINQSWKILECQNLWNKLSKLGRSLEGLLSRGDVFLARTLQPGEWMVQTAYVWCPTESHHVSSPKSCEFTLWNFETVKPCWNGHIMIIMHLSMQDLDGSGWIWTIWNVVFAHPASKHVGCTAHWVPAEC